MREELEAKLMERYGILFKGAEDPRQSLMYFGFACGDGWYTIIENLCGCILNEYENDMSQFKYKLEAGKVTEEDRPEPVRVVQVKEKFGGLRFYVDAASQTIHGMIRMAEAMSYHTCEDCGNPGERRPGGWIHTFCDSCHAAYEAKRLGHLKQT
jgi:hypothetical protein